VARKEVDKSDENENFELFSLSKYFNDREEKFTFSYNFEFSMQNALKKVLFLLFFVCMTESKKRS
jgi:hypothetical protein